MTRGRASAPLLGLLAQLACGSTASPPTTPAAPSGPIVVSIAGDTPAASVIAAVKRRVGGRAGSGGCTLLWGQIAAIPRGAIPVDLEIAGQRVIEGVVACGADAVAAERLNPRVHQVAFVEWSHGTLRASHPSGPGTTVIDLGRATREPRTFVLFGLDPGDHESTASELVTSLRGLPRVSLFEIWALP